MVSRFDGHSLDPHYLAYFDCFNRQQFYEAHEVLEQIWLPQRDGPEGPFFKGLIQLAGAFVHLQKGRNQPAAALFRLAENNFHNYPVLHHRLELSTVFELIRQWREQIESGHFGRQPFSECPAPKLQLLQT